MATLRLPHTVSARSLERSEAPPLSLAALSGRLVELSGKGAQASLSAAMQWVLEAQKQGELAAWVQSRESAFYPPDAALTGVDLSTLPIVSLETPSACARAAEQLLRSGAFLLVVLDLPSGELSMAAQSRLLGLAQKHASALVCVSEKSRETPSLGSLISLRVHTTRTVGADGRPALCCEIIKDKTAGPGGRIVRPFTLPSGAAAGLTTPRSVNK